MKKTVYIIFLVFFIVILSACNSQTTDLEGKGVQNSHGSVENVDVRNSHGSIEGIERMSQFYNQVQKGVPANLRIVHYTIEGDPILTDLNYDGELLKVKHDSTRDKFGSGEITKINCRNLVEEVSDIKTNYVAVNCSDGYEMLEVLTIHYNLSEQDLFEFELKYGVNQENEINTLTNTAKIAYSNKETEIISDLYIATEVKQEVYKRLVFANYLGETDLTTKCEKEGTTNYYLNVHINGGQREFQWNECDQSTDGMTFTNIANYVIKQISN